MKKNVIFLVALMVTSIAVKAQNSAVKIGYTNAEYILSFLPESKQIQSELSDFQKQLETQLDSKTKEFQQKVGDFQKNQANMIPEVRNDKQQELQNLQASIEKFQQDAQGSLQKKQADLLQPAYDKIQKAIDAVAKENGYTYVFNSGQPEVGLHILLYAKDEDNISNLVLKKLGITPPANDKSQSLENPQPASDTTGQKPAGQK